MLRMTPLASAIVALLIGIEAYAAEETFDTHFMIGGMKDQQVANIRLDDNQPLPGQYDIDIYVNKQWRGKYEIIVKDNPQETCLSREMIKRLGINTDNFAITCFSLPLTVIVTSFPLRLNCKMSNIFSSFLSSSFGNAHCTF